MTDKLRPAETVATTLWEYMTHRDDIPEGMRLCMADIILEDRREVERHTVERCKAALWTKRAVYWETVSDLIELQGDAMDAILDTEDDNG